SVFDRGRQALLNRTDIGRRRLFDLTHRQGFPQQTEACVAVDVVRHGRNARGELFQFFDAAQRHASGRSLAHRVHHHTGIAQSDQTVGLIAVSEKSA
nr:hypothetical protein [Tanacetum cinerariifolium]